MGLDEPKMKYRVRPFHQASTSIDVHSKTLRKASLSPSAAATVCLRCKVPQIPHFLSYNCPPQTTTIKKHKQHIHPLTVTKRPWISTPTTSLLSSTSTNWPSPTPSTTRSHTSVLLPFSIPYPMMTFTTTILLFTAMEDIPVAARGACRPIAPLLPATTATTAPRRFPWAWIGVLLLVNGYYFNRLRFFFYSSIIHHISLISALMFLNLFFLSFYLLFFCLIWAKVLIRCLHLWV